MKHLTLRHLLLLIGLALSPLSAEAQPSIEEWRRWETTIVAARNYVGTAGPNQGNPYRDLVLRIRFTSGNSSFVQDAFWTGNMSGNTVFKVRAKLAAGQWTWRFESCTGSSGSPSHNCATDPNLTAASGTINVTTETAAVNHLYTCGELRQLGLFLPSGVVYSDLERTEQGCPKFNWYGDTAWTAPIREIFTWNSQQGAEWIRFLDNRKAKGFTVVLVAPAPSWTPASGDDWPATPAPEGFSLTQSSFGPALQQTMPERP